ncbi:unnamed protein product [Ectocarpus fasciculatus]
MAMQQRWGWSAAVGSENRSDDAKLGVTDTHPFLRETGDETHVMSGVNLFQSAGCPQALSRSQAEAALDALDGGNTTGNTITLLSYGSGQTDDDPLVVVTRGKCDLRRIYQFADSSYRTFHIACILYSALVGGYCFFSPCDLSIAYRTEGPTYIHSCLAHPTVIHGPYINQSVGAEVLCCGDFFLSAGRCGNHFLMASSYLAMGFCCRSRLLTLPAVDTAMPDDEGGGGFKAGERWFDFSGVTPPWPGFEKLGDNPEVCRPQMEDGAGDAFGYERIHSRLLRCMNRVYLRGCEKAYLGKVVDLEGFCPKQEPGKRKGAGSLVIHIRSGDIFNPDEEGRRREGFGQPPLQYYLHVLEEKDWDSVTFLTAAWMQKAINPTFAILEIMAKAGTLGGNVRMLKNRSLLEDIREMLCADALATSRSSMSFLTFAHSRATTFFVPTPCGNGGFRRMRKPPVKATFDNTTLLLLEKPDAEVYGTVWPGNSPTYSVYEAWHDTPEQLLEMATFSGIEGVQKCSVHPPWRE